MKPFHDLLNLQMTRPGREREAYRLLFLPFTTGPCGPRAPATALIPLTYRYLRRLRDWIKRTTRNRKSDVFDHLEDDQGLSLQHLEVRDQRPWLIPQVEPRTLAGESSEAVITALETAYRGEIAELPEGVIYPELPLARPRTVTSIQVQSTQIRWQVTARDGEAWWRSAWVLANRLKRWQKMLRVYDAPRGVRPIAFRALVEESAHAAISLLEEQHLLRRTNGSAPSPLSELTEEMIRPLLEVEDKRLRARARSAVDGLVDCVA